MERLRAVPLSDFEAKCRSRKEIRADMPQPPRQLSSSSRRPPSPPHCAASVQARRTATDTRFQSYERSAASKKLILFSLGGAPLTDARALTLKDPGELAACAARQPCCGRGC